MAPLAMAVTPHHLASESAISVLRDRGNAIEAMVAAAATIAVVYPHMNGLGGDGFWLILPPNDDPIAIDACGAAGSLAHLDFYHSENAIPYRGPKAALTVAGTVSGWQEALALSDNKLGGVNLPLARLLRDAIRYATDGIPVTASQAIATAAKHHELAHQPGFSATFLPEGELPRKGSCFIQPALAQTLRLLSQQGLESFYRGMLGKHMAREMSALGMPLTLEDLQQQRARCCIPLHVEHSEGDLWNMTPPTQGIVSLAILGITDHLAMMQANELETVHRIVEATKKAFILRDRYITDPRYMDCEAQSLLTQDYLITMARQISDTKAASWESSGQGIGDTVWMGVMDNNGLAVSFIQSIYHEFGSGVVIPGTGITWQNRGTAFSLNPNHLLTLSPGKKPFHTLNPAVARLKDGRTLIYGSMGGDGQPQTQAAIFIRYVMQGMPLQQAVSAPRWLLGRTWGQSFDSLKLECRFSPDTVMKLRELGHQVEMLPDFSEVVGHAGAIVRHNNGMLEGAYDPRSNGSASGF